MAGNTNQPGSSQNALSEFSPPSLTPTRQEVKCVICGRLSPDDSDQPVAGLFLSGLEPEDQSDMMFGRFLRKEATVRLQGQEWTTVLRIASLSIEQLWCGRYVRPRFNETDAIVFVLSVHNRSFDWFVGMEVMDKVLELDMAAPPQLARVMVATYTDLAPETWAIRESQVLAIAKSYDAELVMMSETDWQQGAKVLENVAEKIVAWRLEDDRQRKEKEARNASLNIQLDFS